jgi:hypothetical protein
MTDLDWPPLDRLELVVPTPRKCKRHEWEDRWQGLPDNPVIVKGCRRCPAIFDPVAARRGKNNRSRGNAVEREVAAKLGLRRVGQFGGPDDIAGLAFRGQVKSGSLPGEAAPLAEGSPGERRRDGHPRHHRRARTGPPTPRPGHPRPDRLASLARPAAMTPDSLDPRERVREAALR